MIAGKRALDTEIDRAIAVVGQFEITPAVLDTVCRLTGMGFAAIARVTDQKWIACATKDNISFGLGPGGELELESTICNEIRQNPEPVVINDVQCDVVYKGHHTPARYGFRSYISYPILLPDGSFFGTLCAIHPEPVDLNRPEILNTFKLFAELIAFHWSAVDKIAVTSAALATERSTSGLREQFIAILGHDLRNPLASVQAGVSMLERKPSPERTARIFPEIHGSIERMWALIDDMLDFARGRLGDGIRLVKKPTELNSIISQVVAELVGTNPDREMQLRLAVDEAVQCDGERISQLISNLVGNALSHGSPDKPIVVEAGIGDSVLRISVANGGVEIPAAIRDSIFHPFSSGSVKAGEGLGLGLFIASEIAKAHGGSLSVASSAEETRFTFAMSTSDAS